MLPSCVFGCTVNVAARPQTADSSFFASRASSGFFSLVLTPFPSLAIWRRTLLFRPNRLRRSLAEILRGIICATTRWATWKRRRALNLDAVATWTWMTRLSTLATLEFAIFAHAMRRLGTEIMETQPRLDFMEMDCYAKTRIGITPTSDNISLAFPRVFRRVGDCRFPLFDTC